MLSPHLRDQGRHDRCEPMPPQRTGYRLPTETEWEFACKAGSSVNRYYGRSEELLCQYAWFSTSSRNRTWPVGQLIPNDLGLFDTLGNVAEWCQDPYQKYSFGKKGSVQIDRWQSDIPIRANMFMITARRRHVDRPHGHGVGSSQRRPARCAQLRDRLPPGPHPWGLRTEIVG